MPRSRSAPRLPSPRVRFGPDYLQRLGRLVVRLATAGERREGAGRASLFGVGAEFVGFRPYRPGDDLRRLDWSLYARMHRPFVRVARREASERWAVLVDASASMGVGRPGKLQRAAEVATAIAALGVKQGAAVELLVSDRSDVLVIGKQGELAGWMRTLEAVVAQGEGGLARLVAASARFRGAGRVFLLGDLLDLEPRQALSLMRRGRELACARILAPEELVPVVDQAVEWIDAETGERRSMHVDRARAAAYERLVSRSLESWRTACARHRAVYGAWSSTTPFETIAQALFEG